MIGNRWRDGTDGSLAREKQERVKSPVHLENDQNGDLVFINDLFISFDLEI